MSQNLVEKIAQKFAVDLEPGHIVRAGDYLSIRPKHVLTHDNTGAVIPKFESIGAKEIADPRQPVFALDHNVQDTSAENLAKYAKIEAFANDHGIDFYPAGRGIGHQIMIEEGYAWPHTLCVASDSHANMYGGIGCLGTPVVRTDAAAIWATGRTWWQVPPVARCELKGKLRRGVTGKDVIITLCGLFSHDEVLNHAVEFVGEGVTSLSISDRLTIANMSTEWGALVGIFPVDGRTIRWLRERAEILKDRDGLHPRVDEHRIAALERDPVRAGEGAQYAIDISLDLFTVTPHVSGPNTVKVMASVADLNAKRMAIQKAYLLSCVNGRVDDLAEAAAVLRDKTVASGVKLYVAAASSEVQAESEKRGDWQILMDAGAIALPPGCGACIGLGKGTLEDGEVGISATNRNFKGRMGSRHAEAYLASPAVVAASAAAGYIAMPDSVAPTRPQGSVHVRQVRSESRGPVRIIPGFPEKIVGELVWCHADNLNTDGIYPGKYTYRDDMTAAEQAEVVMENYDPEFRSMAHAGDILVGGSNFGTGSSREQAATALKHFGIPLLLAGSFSETYKRNAINNGFIVIESPDLVKRLRQEFGSAKPTIRTGLKATLDFRTSTLKVGDLLHILPPLGVAAQELVIAGGLEQWVAQRL